MTLADDKHAPESDDALLVSLESVTLVAGNNVLLHEASLRFPAGQVSLVVGRSGVGKSTLLRAIAGLLGPTGGGLSMKGRVELVDAAGRRLPRRGNVGVVFQDFALFDEWSPLQNVQMATAHRGTSNAASAVSDPAQLLTELGVPQQVPTGVLSGGQRQRLAIARVLARAPDVVLYDEPTSGLDAATAEEVTNLIHSVQREHPHTIIIVTHDFESLSRVADNIFLFDPTRRAAERVPREQWDQLDELLAAARPPVDTCSTSAGSDTLFTRVVTRAVKAGCKLLESTSRIAEAAVRMPVRLVPAWPSLRWGMRFFRHYLKSVAGPSAWLYIAIAGCIIGFVATYFTFRFLPNAVYTKPLVIEDLLRSMGFALYRILVPILVTILIAARCGAAVASDIGGKEYGRQIDALRTLGIRPQSYLLTGTLYAFLLGTPWLVAIGYAASAITSLIVFSATHPDRGPWFWQQHFHRELIRPGHWFYTGTAWLMAKTLCCAVGIALISFFRGARPKRSTRDVSQGVTTTILWSTLYVLLVHFIFAFVEFAQ